MKSKSFAGRNSLALATTPGISATNTTAVSELVLKVDHLEKRMRTANEKTLVMDTQMQHYGEAIEEIAK